MPGPPVARSSLALPSDPGPPLPGSPPPPAVPQPTCPICALQASPAHRAELELGRSALWLLRHHPLPAPLPGWLLLDARRHLSGPLAFSDAEAASWGLAVRAASLLVQQLCGCERVYAIAFGEGARHLHLHLIPRFASEPASEAWAVADLYRAMVAGTRPPAAPEHVAELVERGRALWADLRSPS